VIVKEVLAGDSVHSLLSILDVITVSPCTCQFSVLLLYVAEPAVGGKSTLKG